MHSKSRFRSRSDHTLDSKGRLIFPSRFRDVLQKFDSDILMITIWGKHLRAFPMAEWELLETKLIAQGKEKPELSNVVRLIVSSVTECTLDKQGRILLPPTLRSEINLRKDVVLMGMLDWVEIWDKDSWDVEHKEIQENPENFQEKLSQLGMF
ncbi:MAG: division/cell wall cluster transcriptional repressor MraZ [Desulfopila sp.]|nr:division/cell wall cluster transcriptional repressor MraZ [Desulfopila sp.]